VNLDFRGLGTSVVRVRILAAGLALLAAGCVVLGWSSGSLQHTQNVAGSVSAIHTDATASGHPVNTPMPVEAKYRAPGQARALFAGLPLMFEPGVFSNVDSNIDSNIDPGQRQGNPAPSDWQAKFVARGAGYSLFFGAEGAILNLSRHDPVKRGQSRPASRVDSLQMKLVGANRNALITVTDPLPGKSNYLLGNDPAKWRIGVPQFARLRYESVYPGINLVFYGNQGQLEYDFQIAPGADPKQAELEFDEAKQLELKDGALVVKIQRGSVRFDAPQIYQEIAGRRQTVKGSFVLRGAHRAGFAIENYDHSRELVIDPLLSFSTYYGGGGNELNTSVAVDEAFNIYLTGSTTSTNLPGVGPGSYQSTLTGVENVYIAKITPPEGSLGPVLDYATYLGGSGKDYPVGIGVDGAEDPYVAGTTTSPNFPVSTTNPYQSGPQTGSTGTSHVFVTRMNSSGSGLIYSSYLSGSGTDVANGMTIDQQGDIYVTGSTTSTNPQDYIPTLQPAGDEWPVISLPYGQPFQATPKASAGIAQFFVTKVNTNSAGPASIAYSTYFGGGNWQGTTSTSPPTVTGGGIAVDTPGNIYFTGTTNFLYEGLTGTSSIDFPILNAYQPCLDQPAPAVIVNPPTCTYASGSAVNSDAFVAKLNPNAAAGTGQLEWSTYLGGTGVDSGTGIAVDSAGNSYVTGTTNSTDIAASQQTSTTSAAFQRCLDTPVNPAVGTPCPTPTTTPYPSDAFAAKFPSFTPSSSSVANLQLSYFSYLGGSANEEGLAITVDTAAGAIITGWTQSNSSTLQFPVVDGQDIGGSSFTAFQDAFIARLNTAATTQSTAGTWTAIFGGSASDTSGVPATSEGTGVALDVNENVYFAGDTNTTDLQLREPLSTDTGNNGGSDSFVAELGDASTLSITGVLTNPNSQNYVSAGNEATFTYTITNSGPDPAYNISVIDSLNVADTLIPVTFDWANALGGECGGGSASAGVSCTIPSLQAGSTATVTIVITPNSTGEQAPFTGGTVQVTSPDNITPVQTTVPAQMSDYSMKISPADNSVEAGDTASYQVSLTPAGVYSSSISLSCSGVPTGASCNFTNSPITLAGISPGSSTLNITTTVRPITTTSNSFTRHFYALWLMVPGLALLGLGSRDRRRRRIAGILLLSTIFWLLALLPACSHGFVQPPVSGTPAGTYTINVTATSGSDTKTQSITLNVS
jgi:uncharacterized repeat protein (TIGR01451 family)